MTFNKCSIDGKIYGYIYDSKNNEIEITDVNQSFLSWLFNKINLKNFKFL